MSKLEKSNPISLPLHVSHNANLSLETQRVEVEITGKGASLSPPKKTNNFGLLLHRKERFHLPAALDLELHLACHV